MLSNMFVMLQAPTLPTVDLAAPFTALFTWISGIMTGLIPFIVPLVIIMALPKIIRRITKSMI